MGNGYFYTLSAIAQSFAAIVALNGIFIISSIQMLRTRRGDLLTKLRFLRRTEMGGDSGFQADREQAKRLVSYFSDNDLLVWADEHSGRSDIVADKEAVKTEITQNDRMVNKLIGWFRAPMIINMIVIAISLVMLPLKQQIPPEYQFIPIVLIILFGLIALYTTAHSIFLSLNSKK
jgi:hypothetical protein